MITCNSIEQLRGQISEWRKNGETIAFVPTMGNLHAGHLSLIELARQRARRVVVSIYVNPLQFSPDEDFGSYPRTLDEDINKLTQFGTDLLFTPDTSMIYPGGELQSAFVDVPGLSQIIEGKSRPVFFKGVATVVLKLFNMVQPDIAVFGEKDFQQLLIIRSMVEDLNLPIEIVGGQIKRETDGLAMSSRNNYLDDADRESGASLSTLLQKFRQQIEQGVEPELAENNCVQSLEALGFEVDYVTLRETSRLDKVSNKDISDGSELIILVAARIGKTRLIDNIVFSLP